MARVLALLWVIISLRRVHSGSNNPLDLPTLPDTHFHRIPKTIWIATKTIPDQFPPHVLQLKDRNPGWRMMVFDNERQSLFMEKHFRNASVLWAFDQISLDCCGAARADIFRYAALWLYGGVYIDYGSTLSTPLEEIVSIYRISSPRVSSIVMAAWRV